MPVHYYPLVNKIISTLNLQEKISFIENSETDEFFAKPFITIAREPGSGGAPIARAVAKALVFKCIDEQIVDEIARSTKKRKDVIKGIDEKKRTALQDMVHSMMNREYVDDIKYVTELAKVILTYAHQGNAVILGRGANFITPFSKGLHVNITAPYAVRVERAMKYEGLNQRQAKKVIADTEKERRDFVHQYLKRDLTKSNAYDLTINTAYFDVNQARDIILSAFYQKFPRVSRYRAIFQRP
jgi:cytidylate kinase